MRLETEGIAGGAGWMAVVVDGTAHERVVGGRLADTGAAR
jgi:hypothetical protein